MDENAKYLKDYTMVHNLIIRTDRLDVYQKSCINNILSNTDDFRIALSALAQRIPCSRDKCIKTINSLKGLNIISVNKVKTINGDWDSNLYKVELFILFEYIGVVVEKDNVVFNKDYLVFDKDNGSTSQIPQVVVEKDNKNTNKNTNIENNIYSHWNSKKIIVHKSLNKEMEKATEKALKKYSDNEIVQAIDTYSEILESDFYFNYKWSLVDFLNRKNGISTFMEEGSNKANYDDYLNKKSKEKNNSTEKPKEIHLRGWD